MHCKRLTISAGRSTTRVILAVQHCADELSWRERNVQNVSQFLTEDYIYVWPDGSIHERKDYLADVGKTTWQVNEISETRVIPHGETVIVLGKWRGKGTDSSGQPIDGVQRYTDVWVKAPDGNWRCALSQSSEIPK